MEGRRLTFSSRESPRPYPAAVRWRNLEEVSDVQRGTVGVAVRTGCSSGANIAVTAAAEGEPRTCVSFLSSRVPVHRGASRRRCACRHDSRGENVDGIRIPSTRTARPPSPCNRAARHGHGAAPHPIRSTVAPHRGGETWVLAEVRSPEGFRARRPNAEEAAGGHRGEGFSGSSGKFEGQGLEGGSPV